MVMPSSYASTVIGIYFITGLHMFSVVKSDFPSCFFYSSRLTAFGLGGTLKSMISHNALHRTKIVWMSRWAAKLSPVRVSGRIHRQ